MKHKIQRVTVSTAPVDALCTERTHGAGPAEVCFISKASPFPRDGDGARPLRPRGGNDCVATPDDIALDAAVHTLASGTLCEPCAGTGPFLRAWRILEKPCDWFESRLGRDFLLELSDDDFWDYIVTNPPYSELRRFLSRCMARAQNVVFLVLAGSLSSRARQRDIREAGFGVVERCEVPIPAEWPQFGMSLELVWLRRGWSDCTRTTHLYPEQKFSPTERAFRFHEDRNRNLRAKLASTGRGTSLRLLDSSCKFLSLPFMLDDRPFDRSALLEASVLVAHERAKPKKHILIAGLPDCTTILFSDGEAPRRSPNPHSDELHSWTATGAYQLLATLEPRGAAL